MGSRKLSVVTQSKITERTYSHKEELIYFSEFDQHASIKFRHMLKSMKQILKRQMKKSG